MEYDGNTKYRNVIYFLLNDVDKTYYVGKAEDIRKRMINHIYNGKITIDTKIFILENNVNIVDMEYVWLNYFSKMGRSDYNCLNRDFNTGSRFKNIGCGTPLIRHHHIEGTTYYKFCKNGIIEDTTNLIEVDDEIILLKP